MQCKNYNLCGEVLVSSASKARCLCAGCYMDWGRGLEFREAPAECPVCFETKASMKFPGSCDHWFCCSCIHAVVYGLEIEPGVSPVLFGCQPCPNGCSNPDIGPQCNCEEYQPIVQMLKHNLDYRYFVQDNTTYVQGIDKCPLCRAPAVYKN